MSPLQGAGSVTEAGEVSDVCTARTAPLGLSCSRAQVASTHHAAQSAHNTRKRCLVEFHLALIFFKFPLIPFTN